MPRRSRRDAVAERAEQRLTEQAERRREAAQRGAQTRRQRRAQQQAEGQSHPAAERPTQALVARRSRQRVHAHQLMVATRGRLVQLIPEFIESRRPAL